MQPAQGSLLSGNVCFLPNSSWEGGEEGESPPVKEGISPGGKGGVEQTKQDMIFITQ